MHVCGYSARGGCHPIVREFICLLRQRCWSTHSINGRAIMSLVNCTSNKLIIFSIKFTCRVVWAAANEVLSELLLIRKIPYLVYHVNGLSWIICKFKIYQVTAAAMFDKSSDMPFCAAIFLAVANYIERFAGFPSNGLCTLCVLVMVCVICVPPPPTSPSLGCALCWAKHEK